MKTSITQNIFQEESIDKFDQLSKLWVFGADSNKYVYYLGSYIYDITGKKYRSIEHMAEDDERSFKKYDKETYETIKNVFCPNYGKTINEDYDDEPSITKFILDRFFPLDNQILHLYREPFSDSPNKCEILYRLDNNKDDNLHYCIDSYDEIPPLTTNGQKHEDIIRKVFNNHFEMIERANYAHIYFFPTTLKLSNTQKTINVTTIISPNNLVNKNDEDEKYTDIGFIHMGLECSPCALLADTTKYLHKLAQEASRKSAKAAIMSRNMSHNLGSHVMAYIKQHLSSVNTMLHDNVFSQLVLNEISVLDPKDNKKRKQQLVLSEEELVNWFSDPEKMQPLIKKVQGTTSLKKATLPFLVGLGQFISYLQERQDFIATIATDYVPYYANVNFKDFIYDELNPDKRYERHKDRVNMALDNILLGNIARSEGLGRKISPTQESNQSDIVLSFGCFNGDPIDDNSSQAAADLDRMRNIEVSLPGGVVGRQAIFSIFENIIRNAAKHGNWRTKGNLRLQIDMFKKTEWYKNEKHLSILKKSDNIDDDSLTLSEVLEKYYFPVKESDDFYYMIITDNLDYDKQTMCNIRRAIVDKYIDDETGIMLETNKGIKEMRISAAWLRSIENDLEEFPEMAPGEEANDKKWPDLTNNKERVPVVYPRLSQQKVRGTVVGNHMQYIICIPKPKRAAILSTRLSDEQIKELEKADWTVYKTPDKYEEEQNKGFEFILFDGEDDQFGKHEDNILQNLISEQSENQENDNSSMIKLPLFDRLRILSSSRIYKLSDFGWKQPGDLFKETDSNGEKTISFDGEGLLETMYEHLSNYQPLSDSIAIHDGKVIDENICPEVKDSKIFLSQGGIVKPFLLRTHHEGNNEFEEFMKNENGVYNKCKYVEGITGNNSTDRLVRNETLNLRWFYSQLHSMKESIAIFDERIFSKTYALEEADFTLGKEAEFRKKAANDFERLQENMISDYPDESIIWKQQNSESIISKIKEIHPELLEKSTVESYSNLSVTTRQRGIHVFTLIADVQNGKKYNLYGLYHSCAGTQFSMDEKYLVTDVPHDARAISHCVKIATLSWNNTPEGNSPHLAIKINDTFGDEFLGKFDRLSIHQGLLDKLYSAFGIKNDPSKKELLTKDFYNFFSKAGKPITYYNNQISINDEDNGKGHVIGYYLPGLCIHSGRSKPGEHDMPQIVPFIQFAAIENAFNDCKFSLVNLLDYARYEQ